MIKQILSGARKYEGSGYDLISIARFGLTSKLSFFDEAIELKHNLRLKGLFSELLRNLKNLTIDDIKPLDPNSDIKPIEFIYEANEENNVFSGLDDYYKKREYIDLVTLENVILRAQDYNGKIIEISLPNVWLINKLSWLIKYAPSNMTDLKKEADNCSYIQYAQSELSSIMLGEPQGVEKHKQLSGAAVLCLLFCGQKDLIDYVENRKKRESELAEKMKKYLIRNFSVGQELFERPEDVIKINNLGSGWGDITIDVVDGKIDADRLIEVLEALKIHDDTVGGGFSVKRESSK